MKLYEIANEYQYLFHEIEDSEGEDKTSLEVRLDEIQAPLENKAVNLAKYINNLRSSVNSIDEEINRLDKMKKSIKRRETSLVDYLQFNMEKCGIEKIESPLFKIQFQKNPCSVQILNVDDIPNEYKRIKTEVLVDKVKIKNEIKVGVIIPGAELIQSKKLVIK